jgi:hypothetical protein
VRGLNGVAPVFHSPHTRTVGDIVPIGKMPPMPDEFVRPPRYEGDAPLTIRPYAQPSLAHEPVQDRRDLRDPTAVTEALAMLREDMPSVVPLSKVAEKLNSVTTRDYDETIEQFELRCSKMFSRLNGREVEEHAGELHDL